MQTAGENGRRGLGGKTEPLASRMATDSTVCLWCCCLLGWSHSRATEQPLHRCCGWAHQRITACRMWLRRHMRRARTQGTLLSVELEGPTRMATSTSTLSLRWARSSARS